MGKNPTVFVLDYGRSLSCSILDAYGHLSVRHPSRSDIFIMPRNMAPALIRSHEDLVQYHVSDGSPVEANPPRGYVERYIHSEIYKKYPSINSVVHSHSKAIIPYGITGTLRNEPQGWENR